MTFANLCFPVILHLLALPYVENHEYQPLD